MSNRVSALNRSPIPDGAGNVTWVDARITEGYKTEEAAQFAAIVPRKGER